MSARTSFTLFLLLGAASCSGQSADSGALDLGAPVSATAACAVEAYDTLLGKYATNGRVDYAGWKATKADMDAFDAYLTRIGMCDVSQLKGLENAAFWINAYNAFNIRGVLDHWPIADIKSVPGFLDKKTW